MSTPGDYNYGAVNNQWSPGFQGHESSQWAAPSTNSSSYSGQPGNPQYLPGAPASSYPGYVMNPGVHNFAPVNVPDKNEHVLQDLQKLFRSPANADIHLRKAILQQYIEILTSKRITVRHERTRGGGEAQTTEIYYKPTKMPLTRQNFARGDPKFVIYFIHSILPGNPKDASSCRFSDSRLYQYPVKTALCGVKSGWNQFMSLSEEDRMIMECTGWNQNQLWAGMASVQTLLDQDYTSGLACKIICRTIIFLLLCRVLFYLITKK
ncbi:Oidioi.mRNA.OKI2018_I69.chr2.g4070.t1.cds [Oikopleura dioica]|uniref:Oidioi.mRNA.OKI2018_I69.chr2.g4070.t1.cds n=1 Tax=Oikopleura dioica TaxID=34765 RepID=A0ABN7SW63_OIKDI|nr:Oidioi.mRNA.OKI2018_I69.chr2.g4070.t1.cds [Oikopleura dioica]